VKDESSLSPESVRYTLSFESPRVKDIDSISEAFGERRREARIDFDFVRDSIGLESTSPLSSLLMYMNAHKGFTQSPWRTIGSLGESGLCHHMVYMMRAQVLSGASIWVYLHSLQMVRTNEQSC